MQDISEYYTKDKAIHEESEWAKVKFYENNFNQIDEFISLILKENPSRSLNVIELGCGSGWIPTLLPGWIRYVGIDKNPYFLDWAREKNRKDRIFIEADVRNFASEIIYDLSFSYAFVKHFKLEEVPLIIEKILSLANYSAIELNIASEEFDDGKEYYHTFITLEYTLKIIQEFGHKVIYNVHTFNGYTKEGKPFDVYTFMTKKI